MAKCAKYNVDSVAQKKKIVCVSLTYLCKSIYSEFGIKSYISTPNGGDKHIYNIIQFSDGKNIKADLQQDLSIFKQNQEQQVLHKVMIVLRKI